MPKRIFDTDSEQLAMEFISHQLKMMAGVHSAWLDDSEKNERHVFTYSGYQFTVPELKVERE